MVKITPFPLYQSSTLRSRGNVLVKTVGGKIIATKWPRKRGPAKTPGAFYQQQTFGIAANWAANAEPANLIQAIEMARETTMIPRDFLTAAAYGKILTIYFENGQEWPRYWDMAANAQLTLDQVTTTVGALIWRSPVGWIEITPGAPGQVLINNGGTPEWADMPAPSPTGDDFPFDGLLYPSSTANVVAGANTGTMWLLEAGQKFSGLNIICRVAAPTCKIAPVVYDGDLAGPITRVAVGPQLTGPTPGVIALPFSADWTVATSGYYYAAINTQGAALPQLNSTGLIPGWTSAAGYPPPSTSGAASFSGAAQIAKCWLY